MIAIIVTFLVSTSDKMLEYRRAPYNNTNTVWIIN